MRRLFGLLAVVTTLGIALVAQAPPPASREVRERAWQANNLGVAYLEQFTYGKAAEQFEAALAIDATFVPARVNLAIAYLYAPDAAAALKAATAAIALPAVPPHAQYVLGLIARSENREDEAMAAFREVLKRDPDDVASLVNLGQLLLQRRQYAEAVPLFSRAVDLEPYNVSALYNLAVAQTRAGDRETGAATTAKFQVLRETGYGTTYSNTYMEQGRYAEAILSTGAEADLVPTAAPPLRYVTGDRLATGTSAILAVNAADLDRDGRTDVVVVNDSTLTVLGGGDGRAFGTVRPTTAPSTFPDGLTPRGVVVADIDNDGKPDVLIHGRGGVLVWRQKTAAAGTYEFENVTAASGIRTALDVRTAALVDVDHDGDVDVVLGGATADGQPASLAIWRNNGDGTFADISATALPGQTSLIATAIIPTDVDLRRDIDLLVLGDDGRVRLWRNMRDASFREVSATVGLDTLPPAAAIAVGDANKDGYPDIAVSAKTGEGALATGASNNTFTARRLPALAAGALAAQMADADNDGLLDIVAMRTDGVRVLRQAGGGYEDVTAKVGLTPRAGGANSKASAALLMLDADQSGTLDLLTMSDGTSALHLAEGVSRGFRVTLTGQVSNRSGVGAKVEVRAGSLWQKLETAASSPAVAPADLLFGLGTRTTVDVARVLWPAGIVQAEPPPADALEARRVEVVELDRKPSSCPYLYTWTGDRFEFVTDFLGGGETGYQASPGVYGAPDPEEYVRIPGDRLKPRDGRLELRVTNELEETLFLDHLSLVAVDHPAGTDVFPLEGLVSTPTAGLRMATVRDRRATARVTDAAGRDATRDAARVDRTFVGGLPLLSVRGYARPH
ncbi:MAG TPA: FG-GAP-like repeat-containing protein, partial [Luteitalea sp.]|nr:FG-GAP-like repeat-containing protein [Luteitalea sp.]